MKIKYPFPQLFPLFFIFLFSCTNSNQSGIDIPKGYQLVWSDEFDYSGLPDSTKWSFDTAGNAWKWGNNEAQYYTKNRTSNAVVGDDKLFITALEERFEGNRYTSARLVTKGKGDWLYGIFEISAILPEGRGMWPAIWMLPTNNTYGGWPASGEIDIMENVGFMPDSIIASVHTDSYNHMIQTQKSDSIFLSDCYDNFHVYKLEWEPEEIKIFVDDIQYYSFKNEHKSSGEWPFDQPFHLLLNVAVGGNWGGQKGINNSIFPQSMVVDYVRVFQKKP